MATEQEQQNLSRTSPLVMSLNNSATGSKRRQVLSRDRSKRNSTIKLLDTPKALKDREIPKEIEVSPEQEYVQESQKTPVTQINQQAWFQSQTDGFLSKSDKEASVMKTMPSQQQIIDQREIQSGLYSRSKIVPMDISKQVYSRMNNENNMSQETQHLSSPGLKELTIQGRNQRYSLESDQEGSGKPTDQIINQENAFQFAQFYDQMLIPHIIEIQKIRPPMEILNDSNDTAGQIDPQLRSTITGRKRAIGDNSDINNLTETNSVDAFRPNPESNHFLTGSPTLQQLGSIPSVQVLKLHDAIHIHKMLNSLSGSDTDPEQEQVHYRYKDGQIEKQTTKLKTQRKERVKNNYDFAMDKLFKPIKGKGKPGSTASQSIFPKYQKNSNLEPYNTASDQQYFEQPSQASLPVLPYQSMQSWNQVTKERQRSANLNHKYSHIFKLRKVKKPNLLSNRQKPQSAIGQREQFQRQETQPKIMQIQRKVSNDTAYDGPSIQIKTKVFVKK